MNLSETAFIARGWTKAGGLLAGAAADVPTHWTLRWFTPVKEVVLCGHATLASAHVIFNQILKKKGTNTNADRIIFETKFKGRMEAAINWSNGHIALNFPSNPPEPLPPAVMNDSTSWVNKVIAGILDAKMPRSVVDDVKLPPGLIYLMLRLKSTGDPLKNEELLSSLQPNFQALIAATANDPQTKLLTGVVVTIQGWTTKADSGKDKPRFYSRFFAPWAGIDEDPVTGSAHTILAPYWYRVFREQGSSFDGDEILGKQLSPRKGEVLCSMAGEDRVKMVGQSRLSMSGEFYAE